MSGFFHRKSKKPPFQAPLFFTKNNKTSTSFSLQEVKRALLFFLTIIDASRVKVAWTAAADVDRLCRFHMGTSPPIEVKLSSLGVGVGGVDVGVGYGGGGWGRWWYLCCRWR